LDGFTLRVLTVLTELVLKAVAVSPCAVALNESKCNEVQTVRMNFMVSVFWLYPPSFTTSGSINAAETAKTSPKLPF
jgi:hypothetical protein